MSLPGTNRSRYARVYGSEPGIDPYTRAVSDVYQDLFHEGSFIGKGIYDVDVFEQALNGRFPENRILSHDLLEGCYARAGLLSDVQVYEEYPTRYSADVSRRYRWIRGDWQILRWALSSVPGPGALFQRNPLSTLVPMEDLRQPSPQSGPCVTDATANFGMDGAARGMVLDRGGGGNYPASLLFLSLSWMCCTNPATYLWANTSPQRRRRRPDTLLKRHSRSCACLMRRSIRLTRFSVRRGACGSSTAGGSNGIPRARTVVVAPISFRLAAECGLHPSCR